MQKVIDDFDIRVQEVDKYFLYLKHLSTPGALLTLPQSLSVNIDAEFLNIFSFPTGGWERETRSVA
jgi:hypothetical protein